jgi:hypothetical protein
MRNSPSFVRCRSQCSRVSGGFFAAMVENAEALDYNQKDCQKYHGTETYIVTIAIVVNVRIATVANGIAIVVVGCCGRLFVAVRADAKASAGRRGRGRGFVRLRHCHGREKKAEAQPRPRNATSATLDHHGGESGRKQECLPWRSMMAPKPRTRPRTNSEVNIYPISLRLFLHRHVFLSAASADPSAD